MPVEIKELLVKVELVNEQKNLKQPIPNEDIKVLKKEILDSCRELIQDYFDKHEGR